MAKSESYDKKELEKLAVKSTDESISAAKGIKTTEFLTNPKCKDIERYTGVTLTTISHLDGSVHLYLLLGVLWTELKAIDPVELIKNKLPYYKADSNFAFAIQSLDDFLEDVCNRGKCNIYWERTDKYYQIPPEYHKLMIEAQQKFKSVK